MELKRCREILIYIVTASLSASCAFAGDLSGKWSGSFTDSDSGQSMPLYSVLKQSDTSLTGTAGPGESHQMAISAGKVEGNHVTFTVQMPAGGTMTFDLTDRGAELKGKIVLSEDGRTASAAVVLKRLP